MIFDFRAMRSGEEFLERLRKARQAGAPLFYYMHLGPEGEEPEVKEETTEVKEDPDVIPDVKPKAPRSYALTPYAAVNKWSDIIGITTKNVARIVAHEAHVFPNTQGILERTFHLSASYRMEVNPFTDGLKVADTAALNVSKVNFAPEGFTLHGLPHVDIRRELDGTISLTLTQVFKVSANS